MTNHILSSLKAGQTLNRDNLSDFHTRLVINGDTIVDVMVPNFLIISYK